jgi:transmembrane sensor
VKTPSPPPGDPIVEQSIEWLLLLQSPEATDQDRSDFAKWCAEDSLHEAAFKRLQGSLKRFKQPRQLGLASKDLQDALDSGVAGRRKVPGPLATLVGFGMGLGVAARHLIPSPFTQPQADFSTTTSERRDWLLADGSQIKLNACSAVTFVLEGDKRSLRMHRGSIVVNAAPDHELPFVVNTRFGDVRALGTAFAVDMVDDHATASVLESSVEITASRASEPRKLVAGQTAVFDAYRIDEPRVASGDETAWTRGVFVVHDGTLADVVEALRPYVPGSLSISARAQRLRVSGTFSLDDTARTLASVEQLLPVVVRRYTRYWIEVDTV